MNDITTKLKTLFESTSSEKWDLRTVQHSSAWAVEFGKDTYSYHKPDAEFCVAAHNNMPLLFQEIAELKRKLIIAEEAVSKSYSTEYVKDLERKLKLLQDVALCFSDEGRWVGWRYVDSYAVEEKFVRAHEGGALESEEKCK